MQTNSSQALEYRTHRGRAFFTRRQQPDIWQVASIAFHDRTHAAPTKEHKVKLTISLLLILLLLGLSLLLFRSKPEFAMPSVTAADAATPDAALTTQPGDRVSISYPPAFGAAVPASTAAAMSLHDRLVAIAQAQIDILNASRSGNVPEDLQSKLGELLRPLLEDPSSFQAILENLASGAWQVGSSEEKISSAEWGAGIALYWGLLQYHTPEGPFFDAGQGRVLVQNLLVALPSISNAQVSDWIARQLAVAEVNGRKLLLDYVDEVFAMRAAFREQKQLFSALFEGLGDNMTPEERDKLFGIFLTDSEDPVLLGISIKNLLQGTKPQIALAMAKSLFDDPSASEATRIAIAQAVVDGSADPFEAARFLAERIEDTQSMHNAYMALGLKDGGTGALESEYSLLSAAGANPKAREMLVAAMSGSEGDGLRRLEQIAAEDSNPRVRGQALMSLTSSDAWTPTAGAVESLRAATEAGCSPTQTIGAASNLAQKAKDSGNSELQRQSVALLKDMASNASLSAQSRLQAVNALQSFVPASEYAMLVQSIH
jgi:hypothetical protein